MRLIGFAVLVLLVPMDAVQGDTPASNRKTYVYKQSAGQPREMEIYFPPNHDPGKARVPGLILFHGGGWTGGSRSQFSRACEYFASRGLVAATAEYRMLSKAEARNAAPGERKRVCVTDAKSAIRWFRSHADELGIDPQRIVTGGGSAGGHISVIATTNPGLNDPQDPSGIDTSVVAYVLFNPAFTSDYKADSEIDALQHVDRNLAPAIAFFGTEDKWKVGWDAVHQQLLDKGNTSTELQLAQGQAHSFFNKDPWQTLTLIAADRFLVRQGLLTGEPTLAPPATGETLVPAGTDQKTTASAASPIPEIIGHWNLTALKQTPAMRRVSQVGPVHSLLYAGEEFEGRSTEVFAFYASPATLGIAKPGERFPGVVLIHGGGGTAFAEWVHLWAKRGYAAIAMDLSGSRPIDPAYAADGTPVLNQAAKPDTRTRLPNGGPNHGHPEKFDSIGGDHSDEWPYHAAASVIRAHSLLRSFPEVIPDRTAVTGISWGGYTTCLVASLDDRFRAAVPVYGCGFLFEGESVQKPAIDKLGERRTEWIKTYDPSSLLPHCRVPILFVNGTNDVHYPLDSSQKSFEVVRGTKQMRIEVDMLHGHPPGWKPEEIGLFIDSHCRAGVPLPVPGQLVIEGNRIRVQFESKVQLKAAELHYTTDDGLRSKRTWKSMAAEVGEKVVTAPAPPAEANTWFVSLTDERGAMVTTPVQFR